MAYQKITIFCVSDGASKVKQLTIPKFLLVLFAITFCLSTVFLVWIIRDYRAAKAQLPLLAQLKKETVLQKNQFINLAGRIDLVTQKMSKLKELDHKLRVMVNLEADEDKEASRGVGGSDPILFGSKQVISNPHKELVRLMHGSLDDLDNEITIDEQNKTELYKFFENQKMLLASIPSIWPAKGWLSSRFGYRISPFTGKKEFHKGLDIATRSGNPVIAPADGVVSRIVRNHGYGNLLSLKHGYGLMTRYAHLQKILVKKGQYVKRGETIALVGNSGRSTGPHLHYEVHLNKVAVNPLRYILN